MNNKAFEILGYNNVKEKLKRRASSNLGKMLIEEMKPEIFENIVKRLQDENEEGILILEDMKTVPLLGIKDVTSAYKKVEFGGVLTAEELVDFSDFLRTIRIFKNFMKKYEYSTPLLFGYSTYLKEYEDVEKEIEYSIEGTYVLDRSSSELKNTRRNIKNLEERIINKLNKFLTSSENKIKLQDGFYSMKNGRYVVPIKAKYKGSVNGTVIELSSSKSTAYIEPDGVKTISEEILQLKILEENECFRILSTLTGLIYEILESVRTSIDLIGQMDYIFARSKYSMDINGCRPEISESIDLNGAKNPEIINSCVPINFSVDEEINTVVITGPNTGGKTVSLKTVGLCVLMNQSGIRIPAKFGSKLPVFKKILVDIGDSQDITQSLSTFSGHMFNIRDIVREASIGTLILIDEIGTGTDPKDGAAIGISVLEELSRRGAFTIVSTHYGEIKEYSEKNPRFVNASMDFNPETLEPLYKLIIGKSGESNAYWILGNIGFDRKILERAQEISKGNMADIKLSMKKQAFRKKKKTNSFQSSDEKFGQGDRVQMVQTGEEAIVYEYDQFADKVTIFKNEEYSKVNRNQIRIIFKSEVLYPDGYDMSQLFTKFRERKLERDIQKGRVNKVSDINRKIKEI